MQMKQLNFPMEIERHEDLEFIQDFYSKERGVKLSKAQTLKILIFETANKIKIQERGKQSIQQ